MSGDKQKAKNAMKDVAKSINNQGVGTNALEQADKSTGESFGTMNSNSSLSYSLIGGRKRRRKSKSKKKK